MRNRIQVALTFVVATLILGCAHEVTKIEEKVITVPPIHITDTVFVPQKIFVLNSQCDTAAILEKYCIGEAEHTDTVGNYWKAKYTWKDGMFTEFVKTHPQQIKYIDTTLNVTYNKVDPGFWWKLWFGFQVAMGWTFILAIVIGLAAVLSKFGIVKLPLGL